MSARVMRIGSGGGPSNTSASDGASGVTPIMWNSGVEPKLASAAPKCLSSSEVGAPSTPAMTGTVQ
ncbi:hypothetical protein D3C83_147950 [compost metagenome]